MGVVQTDHWFGVLSFRSFPFLVKVDAIVYQNCDATKLSRTPSWMHM